MKSGVKIILSYTQQNKDNYILLNSPRGWSYGIRPFYDMDRHVGYSMSYSMDTKTSDEIIFKDNLDKISKFATEEVEKYIYNKNIKTEYTIEPLYIKTVDGSIVMPIYMKTKKTHNGEYKITTPFYNNLNKKLIPSEYIHKSGVVSFSFTLDSIDWLPFAKKFRVILSPTMIKYTPIHKIAMLRKQLTENVEQEKNEISITY